MLMLRAAILDRELAVTEVPQSFCAEVPQSFCAKIPALVCVSDDAASEKLGKPSLSLI